MKFVSPLTLLLKVVDKITVEERVSDSLRYIFLKRYCTKLGQKFRVLTSQLKHRKQYEGQLITNDIIMKSSAKCVMSVVWPVK